MWILYLLLGVLACALIFCAFLLVALLHTRDRAPGWEKFDGVFFAHRGLHDDRMPENSQAAFAAAVREGFGIEFDLHLTRDGALVVHHDASAKRLCGVDLKLNDASLAEVRALSLPDGSQIPTFDELLALVNGKVPLLIELKNDGNNGKILVDAALRALENYPGAFLVESFDPRVLCALKKAAPNILRGQLSQNFIRTKDAPWYMRPLLGSMALNLIAKPDFIAYCISHRAALPLKLLDRAGKKICFWTVRSREDLAYCASKNQNPIFEKIPVDIVKEVQSKH